MRRAGEESPGKLPTFLLRGYAAFMSERVTAAEAALRLICSTVSGTNARHSSSSAVEKRSAA
jgi:hypothetical protein